MSIVVQICKTRKAKIQPSIDEYDNSKDPFAEDTTTNNQIDLIPREYDESKNPFNDDSDEEDTTTNNQIDLIPREYDDSDEEPEVLPVKTDLGDVSMEIQQNLT
jgi:hypothetical protein